MPEDAPGASMPPLVAACRALYAAIDRLDHVAARRVGVSRNDLRALNALERGPLRAGDLAHALELTTGSVSTLIDRLEHRGLVERRREAGDRRVVLVALTDRTFAALGPLYRRVADQVIAAAAAYGPDERIAALRHLEDVATAYRDAAGGELEVADD
ncbi:MAG: MarR family transcriptional regulator [Myxococcota bacterium]